MVSSTLETLSERDVTEIFTLRFALMFAVHQIRQEDVVGSRRVTREQTRDQKA